jgi:hypothetical protein
MTIHRPTGRPNPVLLAGPAVTRLEEGQVRRLAGAPGAPPPREAVTGLADRPVGEGVGGSVERTRYPLVLHVLEAPRQRGGLGVQHLEVRLRDPVLPAHLSIDEL